jgi:hypothetical protein
MQLSQEIFNILKGANIKLKLFDPLGNKTLDPEQSARFYAYDNDFLITIRNSDEQVELVVQAGASFNFDEHKDVLNSIKKAGHNAMAEYNIRKFDKKIEPKDFAHETVKEESTEIDRLKELSGITPVKEQILTEWVWLVPMLATAVRIGVPALKLLLKGGKAASKVIKPVAVTTTTNLVKKSTTSGVIVGATGMWAWDKVTDVVDAIKEWGVDMDDDALGIFSQIVVKYGIPAAAVGAILYGGKQLKDYMAGDEAEKDAENEKGDTTINNYYGADQQPATEEVISEEPVFPEEVELAGDSIWIEDEMWESDYIEVSDITVETDEDGTTDVHVEHNGPWEIYTDTGFAKEISKLVGMEVDWSEQGMQAAGVAHLEAFAQSNESADEVRRLKELSGIQTEIPRDGKTNNEIGDKNIFDSESTEESYSPGDENEAGYVSNCCGAPIADVSDGIGRCSDCKEMAEAEKESEYYEGTTVTEDPEERKMQVTNADKEGNTEAWKRFRAGDPRYEWAGDKKEEAVTEAGEKKVSFKDFMSWFFSDSGDDEYAGLGQEAVDTINREGSVTYTPQDMFNRSGYIPGHLVQGASQEEEDAEYDPSELTLVESTDSITISKFGDGFIAEGYTPATGSLKTSYIQLPENTKLIIKHSKGVNEEVRGSRSRNIKALFIENSAGERFRFPQKYLQGAKAMANHVSHGGTPYDAIGESIIKLCEDVAQCSQFLRHVRTNKLVNENNEYIVETIKAQLKEFKNTVKGLQTVKGYNNYQAQASTIVEEKDAETVDITGKFMYNTFKTANMDAVLETVARIVKERDTMTDLTKQNISRLYDMIKGKEDFKLTIDPNDPEHPDNEDPIKYSGGMGEMAKLSAMLTYLAMSSKNDEVFNVLSHLGSELYNMPDNHVIMLDKITKYLDKNNKTSSNTVEVEGLAESILSELRRNIA